MSKQRIFDSIEHLKHEYNLNVEIPKDVPEDCNVISWEISNELYIMFYREGEELCYWDNGKKDWYCVGVETLEHEVSDDVQNGYDYVYLRLATKDNSDVFTPERLLGVKSNKGFVTAIYQYKWNNEGFVVDFDGEGQYQPSAFKYYISDDSDETVSFEEYVNKFYSGGISEAKFTR